MKTLYARDVMTEAMVTVREDLDLEEVAALLSERQISGAPVVDAAGSLLGVVSNADVTRSLHEGRGDARSLTVRRIMTPVADTIPPDTTVFETARLMVAHHYHRMVVAEGERPVGIVSSMDLLRVLGELG